MRLYIISNRLPVKVALTADRQMVLSRSEGGLATGLNSLEISCEKRWIGWPGVCTDSEEEKRRIRLQLEAMNFHPVFLSEKQYENYYEGYNNSTIWPLCHYFYAYTQYRQDYWAYYKEVNMLFCEEIAKIIQPDDWVWVQDYHLMLLPGLLRKKFPFLHIGYFHHIPFPSYELFRILPERACILDGLLGADFIAFHTHDYVRHFISAAERVLNVEFNLEEARVGNRIVRVDALPMGINYALYHKASEQPKVQETIAHLKAKYGGSKLILSVDRLDYSKGILHRLRGFANFLEHHPEYREKVVLVMVLVPSRDRVDSYADLKTRIDKEIGLINGCYSTVDWTPVYYFYHGFLLEELTAMYYLADVALVTPLRDGMNLVAKEYVATKRDNQGVLILSEMAGAAVELHDALTINPNDISQIENAIHQALQMPEAEQKARLAAMQTVVSRQTVNKWAGDFMGEWQQTVYKNQALARKKLTSDTALQIQRAYTASYRRLIILDYDGTLVGFQNKPQDACPTPELIDLLKRLASDPCNHVVINSGRDHFTLEKWLGAIPLSFAAEHGAFYKENGAWHKNVSDYTWNEGILSILKLFVNKTPKSSLEYKETSLAWHYREVDSWLGELRSKQLVNALVDICLKQRLQIMQGNKVVEIKRMDCTKGTEIQRLLQNGHYDFILAMGDDVTDEDMFCALPANAYTIKVGNISDTARFHIPLQAGVLPFLSGLARSVEDERGFRSLKGQVMSVFNCLKNFIGK